jgi:hypothetical protein
VDYGDGKRRFIDDSRWWNAAELLASFVPTSPRFGVARYPDAFLIGPDGRFLAVRISNNGLRDEVSKAIGVPEKKP